MELPDPSTDQNVDNFLSFTGCTLDRAHVIKRLRYHNNNLEAAVNDYWEDPNSTKYDHTPSASQQTQAWNSLPYNNDKDGPPNTSGIGFRINANDEYAPTYGPNTFDGAPSRPPSRTSNNRSPLTKVIDLTAQAEAADPSQSRTYDPNGLDDPGYAQAIADSLQDSGVTSTSQAVFGPANRSQDEYEQGQWGMVPIGKTSAHDILLDPEPEDRKRDFGVPAFLKPSVGDNRLAALLTMYYEIPMLRELFLDRSQVIPNYGNDKEWWSGKIIEAPMIVGGEGNEMADVLHEVQRLMAFLDKTDRSYGSVEALANLPLIRRKFQPANRDLESAVLEVYQEYFQNNQAKTNDIFSRGVDGPQENITKVFAILELALPKKDSYDETIYDIADNVLWDSADLDLDKSPFLANIGEVITFRLSNTWGSSTKEIKVSIPAVWYPDRYLFSSREAALEMRLKKDDVKKQLYNISVAETTLTTYEIRHGEFIKVEDLLKAALQHDMDELENDPERAIDNLGEDIGSQQRSAKTKTLSAELRKLAKSIDRKLQALNEEKEKAKDALRELSKLYTQQSEDPEQPTLHKYTLRGVSTSKDTMYICRQAMPDLIDMDLGDENSDPKGDQWWKIHYAASDSKPVNVEKTTEKLVLEAAGESKSSMLVYASEKAMAWQTYAKLPVQLEQFVRKDNSWFKTEFPQRNSPVSSPKSPASPSKRKTGSSETSDEVFLERKSLKISEKEIMDADFDNAPNGNGGSEMIMGVDPSLQDQFSSGQEMQERSSMRMLSAGAKDGVANAKPIDSMDLDQIMEDENIAQESGAVRHVGFMD